MQGISVLIVTSKMHFQFIPYGKRGEVELLLRDMDAQKHRYLCTKGKKKKYVWMQGQVRQLPFGVYEYIFPREDLDIVLTTMITNAHHRYTTNFKIWTIRKALGCQKIPEFKTKKHYLWIKTHVNIIPLGITEDEDLVDSGEELKGWTHEAI